MLIEGSWYVTHAGLLRLARRGRCSSIQTETVSEFCDPAAHRWVIKATVFKTARAKGFVGYGDADPANVSPLVHGAEMRIAETRAVNRALRKAYGIGLCSVEELGTPPPPAAPQLASDDHANGNGPSRLRDRLLLLIRQQRLDAAQVKHYATQFCGTQSLREAGRDQVEKLLEHLTALAAAGRDQLLQQLAEGYEPQTTPAEGNKREAA